VTVLCGSDKLGELERDKLRLREQLDAQRRDTFTRERAEYYQKRNKSKNLLKKGFKKLKGKIQVRWGVIVKSGW